jgi:hypothetical protein
MTQMNGRTCRSIFRRSLASSTFEKSPSSTALGEADRETSVSAAFSEAPARVDITDGTVQGVKLGSRVPRESLAEIGEAVRLAWNVSALVFMRDRREERLDSGRTRVTPLWHI